MHCKARRKTLDHCNTFHNDFWCVLECFNTDCVRYDPWTTKKNLEEKTPSSVTHFTTPSGVLSAVFCTMYV
jgi:hypothetical protein